MMIQLTRRSQRGFGSVAAIVWLVALAAASTIAASIAGGSTQSAALEGLAIRAQAGSDSGVAWAATQAAQGVCMPKATFSGASALPGFEDMTVIVACSTRSVQEGATAVGVFTVVSTACSSDVCPAPTPPSLYAQRRSTGTFWR